MGTILGEVEQGSTGSWVLETLTSTAYKKWAFRTMDRGLTMQGPSPNTHTMKHFSHAFLGLSPLSR